jgi:hypothetical protein
MENRVVIIGLPKADEKQAIEVLQNFCGLRRFSWLKRDLIVEFDLENVTEQAIGSANRAELRVNGKQLHIRRATDHDCMAIFDNPSLIVAEACYTFTFNSHRLLMQKPQDDGGTGANVWVGSLLLASWVALGAGGSLMGKSVVEIGAGLALPSLVAGAYASSVLVTDCMAQILEQVNSNVALNGLQAAVQTRALDWKMTANLDSSCAADVVMFSGNH